MCLPKLPYPKQRRSRKTSDFLVKTLFSFGCISGSFWHCLFFTFLLQICVFLMASQKPDVHPKACFQYQHLLCSSILFCYLHDILVVGRFSHHWTTSHHISMLLCSNSIQPLIVTQNGWWFNISWMYTMVDKLHYRSW